MIVTVSIAATVPIKATGRSILRVMSLSPEFGSSIQLYQIHSGVATLARS
jgi:hypothetical protein